MQGLFSARQASFSQVGIEKITLKVRKSEAYRATPPPNARPGIFPSGFCYIGTWQNISKIVWQNILSYQGGGQGIGCGTCQIPESGSRQGQIQVLQKTGMDLF